MDIWLWTDNISAARFINHRIDDSSLFDTLVQVIDE